MAGGRRFSCETAAQTREWIDAIVGFIKPYTFLMNAHVVNFFKDRLWEDVDQEWMDCLRMESVDNLLLIPSGVVQDHWPPSLKKFVQTTRSVSFPRDQANLHKVFPGLHMESLDSVLTQGMNMKKKHEVEVLSAVVSFITERVGAQTVIDVGAGQGYLAQVLSFQYGHSVVAIDACSHHGRVTDARAARIKKHYMAQMRKSGSVTATLKVPKTVTCQVSSIDMLKALADSSIHVDEPGESAGHDEEVDLREPEPDLREPESAGHDEEVDLREPESLCGRENESSSVLAGLHACGDLSVTMLKTFMDLTVVKAVVSIGCCYNLLSEDRDTRGFPVSHGIKSLGLSLGKCSRDLACQSAERWRSLREDAGLHNFELHALRAAFQMVLSNYYPETISTNPSIGRQGKAMRRQQQRKVRESALSLEPSVQPSVAQTQAYPGGTHASVDPIGERADGELGNKLDSARSCNHNSTICERTSIKSGAGQFEKFSLSGLQRLGLEPSQDIDFDGLWKENEPFMELIGPYWSLRAALGSALETLILLDRLLFLQEQESSLKAFMLPLFDPSLSPRNIAIIAMKI